jgi:hypothetical protein
MTWDFVLSIILGITIGALICRFIDNKKKQEKNMGYELLKEQMNKFHDKLFQTDTTVRKRFISNPNKKKLSQADVLEIQNSISELESVLPLVKQRLNEQMYLLISPGYGKTTAEDLTTDQKLKILGAQPNDVSEQS